MAFGQRDLSRESAELLSRGPPRELQQQCAEYAQYAMARGQFAVWQRSSCSLGRGRGRGVEAYTKQPLLRLLDGVMLPPYLGSPTPATLDLAYSALRPIMAVHPGYLTIQARGQAGRSGRPPTPRSSLQPSRRQLPLAANPRPDRCSSSWRPSAHEPASESALPRSPFRDPPSTLRASQRMLAVGGSDSFGPPTPANLRAA